MKKTLFRMGGFLVVLVVVLAAGRLWAENKEKKTAPRTRVGVFNLTYVLKNYDKYKRFQEEIATRLEPFKERDATLRAQLDKLRAQAEKAKKDDSPIVQTKAEDLDLEERAKKIQRELEDNSAKAKNDLGKRSDDEMIILFADVEDVVKRYAASHDLDLVMHYNDAMTREDYMSAQNIVRKLNTGALMPIYMVPETDITKDIVKLLNQRMRKESADE